MSQKKIQPDQLRSRQWFNNPEDLIGAIRKNKGKLIEVGYIRGGKQSKVNVKL